MSNITIAMIALAALMLGGCAAQPPSPDLPPTHPASARAAEAPLPALPDTLAIDAETASSLAPADVPMPSPEAMSHDMPGMKHGGAGMKDGEAEGGGHAGHQQQPQAETQPPAAASAAMLYVCPMHKEVQSDKPGKCPKCKMALKPKKAPASTAPAGKPAAQPAAKQGEQADPSQHQHGGNK